MEAIVLLRRVAGIAALCCATLSIAADAPWQTVQTKGSPTARHEAGMIAYKGKIYLLGGRGIKPVDVYDPKAKSWTQKAMAPREFHHFQAVVYGNAIYIIGALDARIPDEKPLERVLIYYPDEDRFVEGPEIPAARRRGAGGTVVHQGKIYWVGGNTNGHIDGHRAWFDEFDPKTGQWRTLADAPDTRDHLQAAMVGQKLYVFGGRKTERKTGNIFTLVVERGNIFDFKTGRWEAVDDYLKIPTPRAGLMAMPWGKWIVYGGGESGPRETAHDEVEAFDTVKRRWSSWPKFQRGRHGTGFAVVGGKAYVAAGSGNRGGKPELDSLEMIELPRK
jgi:hypothetical protein